MMIHQGDRTGDYLIWLHRDRRLVAATPIMKEGVFVQSARSAPRL